MTHGGVADVGGAKVAATATKAPAGTPGAPVARPAGTAPFGAESAGQGPQVPGQPDGWEMQTIASTARPPAPPNTVPVTANPGDLLGWSGTASALPQDPKASASRWAKPKDLWANPKVRHGLIVAAGLVVIGVGVALALLSGRGSPPAEELGASLAQVYSAFQTNSPTANGLTATTAPPTTTASAEAAAPVGDVATSGSSKSSAPSRNYGQTEDDDPPTAAPAPICPGTNPACGPFRWDSEPGPNTPQTLSISPGVDGHYSAKAGEAFTVTVSADDPDSEFPSCWIDVKVDGGGVVDAIQCTQEANVLYPGEYGSHPVPAPVHGRMGPVDVRVTFPTTGTYELTITTTSGKYATCGMASEVNCNPYGDHASETITVEVS